MSQQLEKVTKRRQHLCTADKIRLMAKSLRNCTEKQCFGTFYDPRNNSFCAYGALGYLSGIPKKELGVGGNFIKVLENYGIDLAESSMLVRFPEEARDWIYPERKVSLFSAIYLMNDKGFSFAEIADHLDKWANNLQS